MKKIFLFLQLTNGSGYSSPTIEQFSDIKKARKASFTAYEDLKNSDYEIDDENNGESSKLEDTNLKKESVLMTDGEDNDALHIITLRPDKFYLLKIVCYYSDEIELTEFNSIDEARAELKGIVEGTEWIDKEEDEKDYFFGESDDESVIYKIISTN